MPGIRIHRREDGLPSGWVIQDGNAIPWWYSRDGIIVKWVFFLSLVVFFLGWIIGGYFHARWRIKKGLPLLAYHRCLVSTRNWAPTDPRHGQTYPAYGTYQGNGYPMYNMPPPPPVYDPNRPPMYEEDGSKIDPAQGRTRRAQESDPAPEYEAPPGPPPAARR